MCCHVATPEQSSNLWGCLIFASCTQGRDVCRSKHSFRWLYAVGFFNFSQATVCRGQIAHAVSVPICASPELSFKSPSSSNTTAPSRLSVLDFGTSRPRWAAFRYAPPPASSDSTASTFPQLPKAYLADVRTSQLRTTPSVVKLLCWPLPVTLPFERETTLFDERPSS